MAAQKFYTLAKVAGFLDVSYMTVRRRIQDGTLQAINVSTPEKPRWRVSEEELRRYQDSLPVRESA